MRALFTLAGKDLRLLFRHRLDAFFVFAFPVIFAAFFTQVLTGSASGASRIKVAIVNEAEGSMAKTLVKRLIEDPGLRAETRTRAEAEEDVRQGRRAAYLLVEAGFGEKDSTDNKQVVLSVDPARSGESGLLAGAVLRIASESVAETLESSSAQTSQSPGPPFAAHLPIQIIEQIVSGSPKHAPTPGAVTLPQGLAWGLMACAAAFGTSLVAERRRGTLVRLRTSPVPPLLVLAGKGLACLVAEIAVCALLLALASPLFGIEPTSWPLLALAALSASICFVGLMTLVGVLGSSEETTFRVAWAGILVLAMLGGAMVPSYLFPTWLDQAGNLSPVRWTILSLEGALWRDFTPADMLAPCGALVGTGTFAFIVAAFLFTRRG